MSNSISRFKRVFSTSRYFRQVPIILALLGGLLFFPLNSSAQDVAVYVSIVESSVEDGITRSRVDINVVNDTASDIRNVDIRLNDGSVIMEEAVVQIGAIATQSAGFGTATLLDYIEDDPLIVRVDYDDTNGNHVSELQGSIVSVN